MARQDADLATTERPRPADPLHVYKAIVQNVVDGDTLEALVDLGFNSWTKQRFRLSGVNAAELAKTNAPSGDADRANRAKAFVVKKLQGVEFVVVKSYKSDIYGRFLADVFYHPGFADKTDVALKGFWLNEELVAAGLAARAQV